MGEQRVQSQNGRAREAYLDGLPAAEQAETLRQAECLGVRPDDPDWIIARAAQQAAERIEAVAARVKGAPEDQAVLKRLESRMGEIEERIGQLPTVRMIEPLFARSNDDPIAGAVRDLTVFAIALLVCICAALIAGWPALRSPVVLVAAFGFGVSCAFGYLWAEPIVSRIIEKQRRR